MSTQETQPSAYEIWGEEQCNQYLERHPSATLFRVAGAGAVAVSNGTARTGKAVGLSIDCSWSRHEMSGGVMDRPDVEKFRDWLTAWLESH